MSFRAGQDGSLKESVLGQNLGISLIIGMCCSLLITDEPTLNTQRRNSKAQTGHDISLMSLNSYQEEG